MKSGSQRNLCIIVCSPIIHDNQKVEATQVSFDGGMDERNAVYTCPHLNGILDSLKKEGRHGLQHAWDLEDILLSERSQSETNILRFLLVEVPRVVTFTEMESRTVVVGGWGKGRMGSSV